ncbi:hypothetical protein [Streptomyces sp. BP-8]|uniref:Uncharacterized protein n=1 Tax=Streptomyces sirii TaxID=3127701 RepID=A0ABZ2QQ31_9ACTN
MAGDQGHNANVSADAGASAKKKSQFTLSDWIEGAVLLVTGVLFVLWLVK